MNAISPVIAADPRAELAAAIRIRESVEATVADAEKAVAGAAAFVTMLESKVQRFADLDAKVSAERAQAVKAAISKGGVPIFAPSPDLAVAMAERVEAENQLTAARSALAELQREAADHRKRLAEVQIEVGRKVEAVVIAETSQIADQIATLESRAQDLRARLEGSARQHFARDGRMVAITVPPPVQRILSANSFTLNTPIYHRAKQSHGEWADFISALTTDAGATFKETPNGEQ